MGMFDMYEPVPPVPCPWCGALVVDPWQGKSGPCLLLLFRQGNRHPVDHLVDEDSRFDSTRFADFELPAEFDLLGTCPEDHYIRGLGRCTDGIWQEIDISQAERQAEGDAERERIRQLRESWR